MEAAVEGAQVQVPELELGLELGLGLELEPVREQVSGVGGI